MPRRTDVRKPGFPPCAPTPGGGRLIAEPPRPVQARASPQDKRGGPSATTQAQSAAQEGLGGLSTEPTVSAAACRSDLGKMEAASGFEPLNRRFCRPAPLTTWVRRQIKLTRKWTREVWQPTFPFSTSRASNRYKPTAQMAELARITGTCALTSLRRSRDELESPVCGLRRAAHC